MSKAIKVEDQIYEELDRLRSKGETFSLIIEALLEGRRQILEAMNMLEGILRFREWQKEQLEKLKERKEEQSHEMPAGDDIAQRVHPGV